MDDYFHFYACDFIRPTPPHDATVIGHNKKLYSGNLFLIFATLFCHFIAAFILHYFTCAEAEDCLCL